MLPPLSLTFLTLLLLPCVAHADPLPAIPDQATRPPRQTRKSSTRRTFRDGVVTLTPANFVLPQSPTGQVIFQGNYEIRCGDYNDHMRQVMYLAKDALQTALRDLRSGAPSHGFQQLFKNWPPSEVAATLKQIADGSLRRDHIRPDRFPSVVCVNPQTVLQYNLPEYWLENCRHQPLYAFYEHPTAYVILCEPFFTLPLIPNKGNRPPKPSICPVWLPQIKQVSAYDDDGVQTYVYQTFCLIHELVHFYRRASLSLSREPVERYSWSSMLELQPQYQLENPTNYQAYVAMVWSDCQLDVHSQSKAEVAAMHAHNEMIQTYHQHVAAMSVHALAYNEMMQMHHHHAMANAQLYHQHTIAMDPHAQALGAMVPMYHPHVYHPQVVTMNAQAQAYHGVPQVYHWPPHHK